MSKPIPIGYQLHITSWENDADAYETKVISGLCEEDVRFLVSIVKQFESNSQHTGGLGNESNDHATLVKVVLKALADNPGISSDMRMHWTLELSEAEDIDELDDDDLTDAGYQACALIYELLGSPANEYYQEDLNFCRVYDGHKVYWFDRPGTDVTAKFP